MELNPKVQQRRTIWNFAAIAIMGLISLPAFAGRPVQVVTQLETACPTCATDTGGTYSMQPDGKAPDYFPSGLVVSEVLTHNAVYNLDTLDTLVNGLVGGPTRTVKMHFYDSSGRSKVPACWGGRDIEQAVNWIHYTSNQTAFTALDVNESTPGRSRLDFNVRGGSCDQQIFRFYLLWGNNAVTIKRLPDVNGKRQWQVKTNQYGTASLYGQGGRGPSKETVYYGDFRQTFSFLLTEQ